MEINGARTTRIIENNRNEYKRASEQTHLESNHAIDESTIDINSNPEINNKKLTEISLKIEVDLEGASQEFLHWGAT